MKKFVFWTGIYNIVVGLVISCPWVVKLLGTPLPSSYFWLWFAAVLVIYLGILLVLCSRNLKGRASLVYWEGILRIVAFLLVAGFGVFGGLGPAITLLGIIDLAIGLVYLIGLPKALNTPPKNLLLDL
jgi:hypothetical protein